MNNIYPEKYTVAPGLAQNLSQVEVNTSTIPSLTTEEGTYPRYSILAYNVNTNGIGDIVPEKYTVAPGLAQNLTYVEIDPSVIPALSGNYGIYPRYAQLVYLLNPSSGGGSGAVDSVNGKTGNVILSASDLNTYTKEEVDNNISALSSTIWDTTNNDSIISKINTLSSKSDEEWITSQISANTETLLNITNNNDTIILIEDNAATIIKVTLIYETYPTTGVSHKSISLVVSKKDGVLSVSDANIQTLNVINSDVIENIDVQQINENLQISITSTIAGVCYTNLNQRIIKYIF